MDHKVLNSGPAARPGDALDQVLGTLPPEEAEAVRGRLPGAGSGAEPLAVLRSPAGSGGDAVRPDDTTRRAIRRVGVIGGGTAGYLTALALRAERPWLDVTLLESRNAYGFVEPLESTGLMMIGVEVQTLVSCLPASWEGPQAREAVNAALGQQWDAIRWLLGCTTGSTPGWTRSSGRSAAPAPTCPVSGPCSTCSPGERRCPAVTPSCGTR
ncbi:tryptophan 7-halogenase [Streptomyces sp. NPDC018045]|uniref:tryptophan 7-halogenase n=1 Tax=Streptomyces sp. NPDC018045 TaxID=3365037 RepID=UPI00378AF76B